MNIVFKLVKKSHIFLIIFLSIFYISFSKSADYPITSIGVIDIDIILNESKAAIDANNQIQEISENVQIELRNNEEQLRNEEQRLVEAKQIMAPEAFEEQRIEFQKNVQNFQIESQKIIANLDKMIATARLQILDEIKPILEEIALENGITIVMEKKLVILNDDNMDITKSVLKKLNKNLPKLKVEFEE